jgi:hypothetical protein
MSALAQSFSFRLIAALLTVYALGGFWIAARMVTDRDPRFQWGLLAAAAAIFGLWAGSAALAMWRASARAPAALAGCGVIGALLCVALPATAPAESATREMWRGAILSGVLFCVFCLLLAWYVRRRMEAGSSR